MFEAGIAAFFGLLIGSFLNVCIYRLPRDLSVMSPARSFCPGCEKTVAWYDNIPVLSFFLLGRKCRHCGGVIPWLYPAVEALTSALFFWSVYSRGPNLLGVKLCILSAIMVTLFFTDLQDRILPDEFTIGGFLVALGLAPLTPAPSQLGTLFAPYWPGWAQSLLDAAIGGLLPAGLFWLVAEAYLRLRQREGLGLGDVKMMLVIGGFLGLPSALATIFLAATAGSVIGLLFVWVAKKDLSSYQLPFGSFLAVAAVFLGLFSEHLFSVYWKVVN